MIKSAYLAKMQELRESGNYLETSGDIPARDPQALPASVIVRRAWTDGSFSVVEERQFCGDAEDYRLQEITEKLLEGDLEVITEPDPAPVDEGGPQ